MARQKRDDRPRDPEAKAVLKPLLEVCRSGFQRPEAVWDDFLRLAEALSLGLARAAGDGTLPQELSALPEVAAVEAEIRPRYGADWPQASRAFGQACGALNEASQEFNDVLGQLYMSWVLGNEARGQFFTPWDVCQLMAQLNPVLPLVIERLAEAERAHPELGELSRAVMATEDEAAQRRLFVECLLPAARGLVTPVSIYDPACGSGTMLLAAASILPSWALPFVRFHGTDIDRRCVQMARVNLLRYGLAPWHIRHGDSLAQTYFDAPEPERDELPLAA